MRVLVLEYDPLWAEAFEQIRSQLLTILSNVPIVSIEHVGSTSIPGLAAKPIIDIDIVVAPKDIFPAFSALSTGGYTYNPEPRNIDRASFRYNKHTHDSGGGAPTEDGGVRRAVYLNIPTGVSLKNHLAVQRVLLTDRDLLEEYAAVKKTLANDEFDHISDYGSAKAPVLRKILAKSDLADSDHEEIARFNVQLGQVLEGWCSQRGNGQTGCERRENQIGMSLVYHHNTCVDTDKETGSHMYSVEKG
ncbi:GrpB/Dephospho-CoA kinase [Phaffia rhodozyma]|uniref:GrpB/Dephospho-CoA kinase n=1 Tax=Phaffia rhodozyma TaxID=264483 RepID=A0A0F7SH13_PHARH|nr:GrpB/Dephospho-CoA kinase [Phaffia rhodozyma]